MVFKSVCCCCAWANCKEEGGAAEQRSEGLRISFAASWIMLCSLCVDACFCLCAALFVRLLCLGLRFIFRLYASCMLFLSFLFNQISICIAYALFSILFGLTFPMACLKSSSLGRSLFSAYMNFLSFCFSFPFCLYAPFFFGIVYTLFSVLFGLAFATIL